MPFQVLIDLLELIRRVRSEKDRLTKIEMRDTRICANDILDLNLKERVVFEVFTGDCTGLRLLGTGTKASNSASLQSLQRSLRNRFFNSLCMHMEQVKYFLKLLEL